MTIMDHLVEREWACAGAEYVIHNHMRCYGCLTAETGWRDTLRLLLQVCIARDVTHVLLGMLAFYWYLRWRSVTRS